MPDERTSAQERRFWARLAEMRTMIAETAPSAESEELVADRVREGELRALFDVFLPDAKPDQMRRVSEIQVGMRADMAEAGRKFQRREITEAAFRQQISAIMKSAYEGAATVLGPAAAARLFGTADPNNLVCDDRREAASVEQVAPSVEELTDTLLENYTETEAEQRYVKAAVSQFNPQQVDAILAFDWDGKYMSYVEEIAAAETAYNSGYIDEAIAYGRSVVGEIARLEEVSDTCMYLVAWAYHIVGRCYVAIGKDKCATRYYEASLTLKRRLDWLPDLPKIATQIKLGEVEASQATNEPPQRLLDITQELKERRAEFRNSAKLYKNLLENSQILVAESYLRLGDLDAAVTYAKEALKLAESLDDGIGTVRSRYVLHVASVGNIQVVAQRSDVASNPNPRLQSILRHLEELSRLTQP